MASPETIEELEHRQELHGRLTAKKTEKTFAQHLNEKLKKLKSEDDEPRDSDEQHSNDAADSNEDKEQQGAREAHLGLAPTQDPQLAAKTERPHTSKRVIVKG